MKVDLLCSGSKGNCCLIRNGDTQIVIDCGSTKKYLMEKFNLSNAKISNSDALLVTHGHSDHISQLKLFKDIPTYSYCSLEDVNTHYIVKPYDEFDIGSFHIQVVGLSHDSPNTVGYIISCEGEKLVYITDTGYISNQVRPFIENATYYIFESNHDMKRLMASRRPMFLKQRILGDNGHMNNEDASNWLSSVVGPCTKEVGLAHISDECNTPELALETFLSCLHAKGIAYPFCITAMEQRTMYSFGNK